MKKIVSSFLDVEIFKICFLINALAYSFYFYPPILGTATNAIFSLWAGIIFIHGVLNDKFSIKEKYAYLLCGFMMVFIVSIFINKVYIVDNIKTFIVTGITFFIIYYLGNESDKKNVNMSRWASIIITYSGLMGIVTIAMYFCNITLVIYGDRACGLYTNPIMSGIIAILSIIASVVMLAKSCCDSKTIVRKHVANIILQLIVLALSNSRSTLLCLCVFVVSLFVLYIIYKPLKHKKIKPLIVLVGAVVLFIGTNFLYEGTQDAMTWLNNTNAQLEVAFYNYFDANNDFENSIDKEEIGTDKPIKNAGTTLDRVSSEQSSSIRMNMIIVGLQVFKESPLVGVTPRNIDYVAQEIADRGNIGIQGIVGGGFHNSYIELLASLGISGVIITGIFAIFILRKGFKTIDVCKDSFLINVVTLAGIISLATLFMFESLIIFVISPATVFFWLLLGIVASEK